LVQLHFTTSHLLKSELNDKTNTRDNLEKYMYKISDFLLENHKPITMNNIAKYSLTDGDFIKKEQQICTEAEPKQVEESSRFEESINDDAMTHRLLKEYRLNTSREEGIKAYFVFSNEELELLIQSKPKTKDELLKIKGFGPKKLDKYGDRILGIINIEN